jgi:hypothetical protein
MTETVEISHFNQDFNQINYFKIFFKKFDIFEYWKVILKNLSQVFCEREVLVSESSMV